MWRGKAVVTATGMQTEMGQIAGMLHDAPEESTTLQKELDRVGKLLGAVVVFIAVVMIGTIIAVEDIGTGDVEFLLRVNQGLVEGWFAEKEPFKYRSLQLTGDEKRLGRLACSTLFGPGKLSLELLGCEEDILPLATVQLSTAPVMLLFENATSFMVAREVLLQLPASRIGCLAYGAGNQVIKSVGYFSMIAPLLREIIYVGDLDGKGIQIASAVSRASKEVPVRPATRLRLAMFEAAASLGAPNGWPAKEDRRDGYGEMSLEFLDEQVRGRAAQLVGRRAG